MDQPANELRKLEKILDTYVKYDEYQSKKDKARNKNRRRHRVNTITEIQE